MNSKVISFDRKAECLVTGVSYGRREKAEMMY